MPELDLPPVDKVEILSLMDNFTDNITPGNAIARRPVRHPDAFLRPQLRAEHGVSMLISVTNGDQRDTFLFDTGVTPDGALHNMDALEVRPGETHALVLSHGHTDHIMGMEGMIKRLGRSRMPIILHPDAFLKRKLVYPDGRETNMIPPSVKDLEREGIELVVERGPSFLINRQVLVSGQVERSTGFEPGLPGQHAEIDGNWEPDPWVYDDQSLAINLKDKGLVVITGCGHAGVINIIRHLQGETGIQQVHAVLGGIHLNGRAFEPVIQPTIDALLDINPEVVVPEHCSGWSATSRIAQAMPDAFVQNTVGTTLVLE